MPLVKVNYSLNNKYFVEKEAFESLIKKAIKKSNLIELVNFSVTIPKQEENFYVSLKVNIKSNTSFTKAIEQIQENIEMYSYNLIDLKPGNISIEIQGEF